MRRLSKGFVDDLLDWVGLSNSYYEEGLKSMGE